MTSPNRSKGTRFERDASNFLARSIPGVDRTGSANAHLGDVTGVPDTAVECKNAAAIRLPAWTEQVRKAKEKKGAAYAAIIIKWRGKNVKDSYVVQSLEDFTRKEALLRAAYPSGTAGVRIPGDPGTESGQVEAA